MCGKQPSNCACANVVIIITTMGNNFLSSCLRLFVRCCCALLSVAMGHVAARAKHSKNSFKLNFLSNYKTVVVVACLLCLSNPKPDLKQQQQHQHCYVFIALTFPRHPQQAVIDIGYAMFIGFTFQFDRSKLLILLSSFASFFFQQSNRNEYPGALRPLA